MKEKSRDRVLAILERNRGAAVSGEAIASKLGISRMSVCKAVAALRAQGYRIDAKTNSGYLFSAENPSFYAEGIKKHLKSGREITLSVVDCVDSTNNALKKRAETGAPEGTVLIARAQSAGRGRQSHAFFSPEGGLYMSVLLRPKLSAAEALSITTAAAAAGARAVEKISGKPCAIKWVNDLYLNGKKICGILTEASVDFESGSLAWAVLGIGINVSEPPGGFPEEIREVAGAVFGPGESAEEQKSLLAAEFLNEFFEIYETLPKKDYMEDYRRRNLLLGKEVDVIRLDRIVGKGTVEGIDDDARLILRSETGELTFLSSGEVSIRRTLAVTE